MTNTRKLVFGLLTALLLVLTACNTAPEAVKEPVPVTAKAMDSCDVFLDPDGEFVRNGFLYLMDQDGRPRFATSLRPLGGRERIRRHLGCQSIVGRGWSRDSEPRGQYQGGHLIGHQLGGWSKRANLVRQQSNFNLSAWSRVENAAAKCAPNDGIKMLVYVSYPNRARVTPDYWAVNFSQRGSNQSIRRIFRNEAGGGANGAAKSQEVKAWLERKGCT